MVVYVLVGVVCAVIFFALGFVIGEVVKEKKALATLVLKRVSVPLPYGVVLTDGDNRITRFIEKPDWSRVISSLVNTGVYLLEPYFKVVFWSPYLRLMSESQSKEARQSQATLRTSF